MGKKDAKTFPIFIMTRKIIRNRLRREVGNKGLKGAWEKFQKGRAASRGVS